MKKKITIIPIILLIILMLMNINVFAATGSFQISAKSKSLTVGGTTTLSITAKECAGVFTVTSSDSSVIAVGSVPDWIEEETKTVTLTAKKSGKATITVTATDVGDTDAEVVSGSKYIDITVNEKKEETTTDKNTGATNDNSTATTNKDTTTTPEKPKEKSTNANLKTLGVRISDSLAKELGVDKNKYDFSGFSKDKTSYNVTIPKNVDSLKVVATPADSNAKVKVTGNSGFEVGTNNKITIKITAEDGKTTKTYTIKVTQLAEEEEKPGNLIEEETELYLTSLNIEGIELSPEFVKDTYSYTATLSNSDINEVKVNAIANNEKAKINISGNTNLVEGENTINIIVTLDDSDVQAVYQINVTKEASNLPANSSDVPTSSMNDIIGMFKGYVGIAIAAILFMIVIVVVLVIMLRKENKRIKNEEVKSKTKEYDVFESDEKEFSNYGMPKDNFIESLYKQRNGELDEEELDEQEIETLEEINRQTDEIFREKVKGQSVEFSQEDMNNENPLEIRRKRRGKGKHSL